ncbi:hypothetical protein [Persicitalea jodogahamensis]|uniref:Uncharacterized protein n=1 Tax=Persicitalea jodogahamensis TaxID=402147 RepID=A0A8J3DBN3_9BACT|nr:hypothetical protein [Persicitalea jodogahamensis]GHB86286.1 hypothetical protein GCM10007390_47220 [Persicitalea jodogahamensis]
MPITVAKVIMHLKLLSLFSLVALWVLFYLHGTGINSFLIPDRLRWHDGAKSRYIGIWYALSCAISYVELFWLLWLVNKFNFWYGKEWLKPSQMKAAKTATVVVGVTQAI